MHTTANIFTDIIMTFKILNKKIFLILSLVLLRAMLDYSYIWFVNPLFSYAGFVINFDTTQYLASWAIFLACTLMVAKRISLASDFFYLISLINIITPITSLFGLNSLNPLLPTLATVCSILLASQIAKSKYLGQQNIPFLKNSIQIVLFISIALVLYLTIWYFFSGASKNFNLDFSQVYLYRVANAELTDIGILAYLNTWIMKVFNVALIAYFLHKKKYILVFVFFIAQIFFFGISAHKSVLFFPFLVFGLWLLYRKNNLTILLPLTYIFIFTLILTAYFISDSLVIPSMIFRRFFFVPAYLTFAYFDFFSDNINIYWSNSFLSSFINYPYETTIPALIGSHIGTETNANNGYISSGFAHAGLLGITFYTFLLGIIINIIDTILKNGLPLWLGLSLVSVPLYSTLTSSDLLTTILTHGLGISLLVLYLFRTKGAYIKCKD